MSGFDHVEHWVFDMDNTLYPPETGFMGRIAERINAFFVRATGLDPEPAFDLQRRFLCDYGTSLAGLMEHYAVEPRDFLDEVHQVALDDLTPDLALRAALSALPGQRLIFTNAPERHAERVLRHLQVDDLFHGVFHIEAAELRPKPDPLTFDRMVERHGVDPARAAFFEDTEANLAPAHALGMTTVLVGSHAEASTAPFVHHRTPSLAPFLRGLTERTAA